MKRSEQGVFLGVRLPWVQMFALAVVVIVLIRALVGLYFETQDDPLFELMMRGAILDRPVGSTGFWFYGVGEVMARLYQMLPGIPWYGLFCYAMLASGLANVAYVFLMSTKSRFPFWQQALGLLVLATLASGNSVVLLNFTRVCILTAGSAFAILFLWKARGPGVYAQWGLVFVVLLVRPESVLLAYLIIALATVCRSVILGNWVRTSWRVIPAGVVLYVLSLSLQWLPLDRAISTTDHRTLVAINDYAVQPRDPIGKDLRSKLIEESVVKGVMWDRDVLTAEILSGWQQRIDESVPTIAWQSIGHSLFRQIRLLVKNNMLVLGLNVLFLGMFWIRIRGETGRWKHSGVYASYHVGFWILLCTVEVFLRMRNRVAEPAIVLYTLGHFFMIRPRAHTRFPRLGRALAMAILGSTLLVASWRQTQQRTFLKSRAQVNMQTLQLLQNEYPGADLLFIGHAMHLWTGFPVFGKSLWDSPETSVTVCSGWTTRYSYVRDRLERLSGRASLGDVMRAAARSESRLLLASSPDYNDLLQRYCLEFYGLSLRFEKISEDFLEKTYNQPIAVYRVKKVAG